MSVVIDALIILAAVVDAVVVVALVSVISDPDEWPRR